MSPPSEEGVTAGIAGTTGSGDPLPLIHPPEGGRISLMLLLRNVKSGPLGAACKKSRSNPHRGTLVTVLGGARNLRLQALVATRGLRERISLASATRHRRCPSGLLVHLLSVTINVTDFNVVISAQL